MFNRMVEIKIRPASPAHVDAEWRLCERIYIFHRLTYLVDPVQTLCACRCFSPCIRGLRLAGEISVDQGEVTWQLGSLVVFEMHQPPSVFTFLQPTTGSSAWHHDALV
jgi:hypothetical protein